MASQSLVAFLAEAGAKVEPRSNGEAEVASQTADDSAPSEERASCPLSSDTPLSCATLNDNATAPPDASLTLDAHTHALHTSPDATHPSDAHIYAAHAAPPEEAQKGEFPMESMVAVESIEKPSSPDNAMPSTIPSTAAVITDCIEADSTPSTAAIAASDASEAIVTPSTETVTTVMATLPSTEAVIVDTITLDSNASASMPSTEAVIADSTPGTDHSAVATTDSTVVSAADTMAPLATDSAAPITTDSTIVEPPSSSPDSLQGSSLAFSKPDMDAPSEELNRTAAKPDEDLPPELDSIQIPAHWHPKPCVHISSIGGAVTEEELLPLFSKFGPIASVQFENDRHDAVLIRYDLHLENGEELLAQVREATNSTKLGDKTLIVEPFRPDSLLFVGNLTPSIDDAALQTMFEPHGTIERAFILKNANGQSKCYGFVEYSLKSQAMTAKAVMGNINMDGRVLRVEWSDCKRVEDMFSTVLFIDRIPREGPQVEGALKNLFGKYGNIRDSHLAIGTGNQIRGFAFIDFYHSASADKAHQALDGQSFEGSSIRVSFANPSKSAQSYRFRYGAQAGQGSNVRGGSGTVLGPPPRGLTRGPSPRVSTPMGLLPSRFMSPARPGMLGFGIGMQFGRGSFDRGPGSSFHGSGRGMLGPSSFGAGRASLLLGNMPPRAGMAVVENNMQKLPFGQGPVTITPSAIVQVATAQARAREEEAKARAEAAKYGVSRSFSSNDSLPMNHYQRLQQFQHQNYLQQQQVSSYEQQYKQGDLYMHQQAHQASLQPQQQAWNQVPQPHSQQTMQQLQRTPYHANASQNFPQQHQGAQNDGYYQQAAQHSQQHGYTSQYGQQHGYQYAQQTAQMYGQVAQQTSEQYQQSAQQAQAAYPQQNYGDQYAAQQQASQQGYYPSTSFDGSAGLDAAQQQAYSAYYQQQAQAQAQTQAVANPEAAASAAAAATQQSYEAQWAAYYASQAAYQQQTSSTDVGQKRSADQMEASVQNQAAYNYAGYPYQQQQQAAQQSNENAAAYQVQANSSAAYQQQAAYAAAAYQQQEYQQAAAPAVYGQTGYEQASAATADGAYQQQAAAFQAQAATYDYSKKPRF